MQKVIDGAKEMFNKVPEITLYFWIIKVLCTTVGETAADFLNINLNVGLAGTSLVTGILLVIALVFQFRAKKYIPSIYWVTVALVSVFGTLVTDNLTDALGVPLEVSTIVFGVLLALIFLVWYVREKTLSIHSIVTRQREIFYWLAILCTFALGTAAGDLMAEGLGLGYLTTGIIVAGVIVVIAIARMFTLNSVLSFWFIYIMTRPLGASIGDYLSQPKTHGGLGLGATGTSVLFIGGIIAIVTYLSITKKDVIAAAKASLKNDTQTEEKGGIWQTVIVVALLSTVGIVGYDVRHSTLKANTANAVVATDQTNNISPLGDLLVFQTITQDTLDILNSGDQSAATKRISDLEYEWDTAQSRLKPKSKTDWNMIDGKIDTVLRELRSTHPNPTSEKAALEDLLTVLK